MAVLSENQESGVRGQESPVVSTSAAAPANTPFKIQLADRLTKLPPYVLARVNALRDQKRKAGQDVIDLGMGNPSEPPQEIVIEKLMEAAQDPDNHGYSKANGILNLRREVAAKYFKKFGVRLDPDSEIIVTIGSKEGFSHLMLASVGPGDNGVVRGPSRILGRKEYWIVGDGAWRARELRSVGGNDSDFIGSGGGCYRGVVGGCR